ncbi:MAG: DUF2784 domain-containing protein [Desulfobulbus sp.]|nr:DUF2784 domain-containing protein [Desulfobulbus sp.]
MNDSVPYLLFADAVLLVHVSVALFVIGGLVCIIIGNRLSWGWVNSLWFRIVHLAAIVVIALQAWLGAICPLTRLEMWLRSRSDAFVYSGSFIGYWLQKILYYDAPDWVFILIYSLFTLAVVASWWYYPPRTR